MILANIVAQAGEVVNSTSPVLLILAGAQALGNLAFCVRLEKRLTKLETNLKWLMTFWQSPTCTGCKSNPTKYRPHPGLKLPKIDEEEEETTV